MTNALFTLLAAAVILFIASVSADAKQADKDAYIKQLETTLAKCLSRGDHPITVGDEIWFCGAAPSGLKAK